MQKALALPMKCQSLHWHDDEMFFLYILDCRVVEFLHRCHHPDGGYGGMVLIMNHLCAKYSMKNMLVKATIIGLNYCHFYLLHADTHCSIAWRVEG